MNFDWVSKENFGLAWELQSNGRVKHVQFAQYKSGAGTRVGREKIGQAECPPLVQIVDICLFLEKLFLELKCVITERLPRKAEKND